MSDASNESETGGGSPFPVLTPAQRMHLEVNGYVVLYEFISRDRVRELLDTIYRMEAEYRATGELPGPDCHLSATGEDYFRIDNLPHLAPCFFDYLTDPRIVAAAEEITGKNVRLEQSDAHVRRPGAANESYEFHRSISNGYSHVGESGLYHYSFVKALTNLTDLGPDDGGTAVVPGTHKVPPEVGAEEIITAALEDPRLICQVEAPAGSTLLFFESLMHSHGIMRSDRQRVLVLGGYTPTMFQTWRGYEPSADFVATLSDEHRALLTGEARYGVQRKRRDLGTRAETLPANGGTGS